MAKTVTFDVLALAKAEGFDEAGRKINKFADDSNKGLGGLMTTIIGLAPAAIPVGAAVAGALVGVAGAGGVALLAFQGIKKEMHDGTPVGQAYTAVVGTLKGNLDGLERTAAAGTLNGIQRATAAIQPLMPSLTKDTALYSAQLGDIAGNTGVTVVSLFRDFEPLLSDIGNQLDIGSGKLANWAQTSDGPKKFVEYAKAELPKVEQFLGTVAVALGHIAEASAPFGGVVLTELTLFGKAIDAIPVPVLEVLIPILSTLVVGLKALKIAEQVQVWMGGLGAKLESAAMGGAGLAGTMGPLAGILIGGYAATQMFGDQLEKVANQFATGKIMADQNVSAMDELSTQYWNATGVVDGTSDAMLQFALSGKMTGQGIGGISDQVVALLPHLSNLGLSTDAVSTGVSGTNNDYQKLIASVKAHGGATQDDIKALDGLHQAFGGTSVDARAAHDATTGLTDDQKKLADQVLSTSGQLNILNGALDKLSNFGLDAAQQELRLKDSLAGATAQVKQNGSAINDNTVKGRSNKEWLLTQISAINSHAVAVGKQTGSVKAATGALASDEAQLRRSATAAGMNKTQVDALIRAYAATPKQVATTIKADTKAALGNITTLQANIQALKDKKISITTYLQNVILPGLKSESATHDSHRASGGHVYAGQSYVVGEKRPEVLTMGGTNGYISPRVPTGGSSGQPIVLEFASSGNKLVDVLFEELRKGIRVKGGNVQMVLGQ